MARDVKPLHKAIERYAGTVEPDDTRLATLKTRLAQIRQKDQENRAIRADRTYMLLDRFAGDNVVELRRKAEEIVKPKSATERSSASPSQPQTGSKRTSWNGPTQAARHSVIGRPAS